MNILVIDDSKMWCTLMLSSLESKGHDVTTSQDVKEAAELLRNNKYDAVLLDLDIHNWLPVAETIPYIKAHYAGPLVIISGQSKKEAYVGKEIYLPKALAEDPTILNHTVVMAVHTDSTRMFKRNTSKKSYVNAVLSFPLAFLK